MWVTVLAPDAMHTTTIITVLVSTLLLIGGVAAVGAAAPVDGSNASIGTTTTQSAANVSAQAEANASAPVVSNDPSTMPDNASDRAITVLTTLSDYLHTNPTEIGQALQPLNVDESAAANTSADNASTVSATDASDAPYDHVERAGPPEGMPEQAADHVRDIHETITSYLDGASDRLGNALSALF